MLEIAFVIVIIIALFAIALSRERHRVRLVRMRVDHDPSATLHSPFVPANHPEFPVMEMLEKTLGRPPIGFASAVEIRRDGRVLWLAEYRTTPLGRKTDHWFTLLAANEGGAWSAEKLPGLISPKLLGTILDQP